MSRLTLPIAALAVTSGLLLVGCSSPGSSPESTEASGCETVRVSVRDISNGAQNAIATITDPDELTSYLEGLSERVTELEADAQNDDVAQALTDLDARIQDGIAYAETLPTPDPNSEEAPETDGDAIAEAQQGIQAAAVSVTQVCTE
ncbi:hypothetical protein ACGGZK_02020 [Agromyces sp. MMS24-K17]|uniref:hypothetical protein n=1 Tax=Agromyces sp. MMS24-K17 TaxID=3372850 RepID=UPI00375433F2